MKKNCFLVLSLCSILCVTGCATTASTNGSAKAEKTAEEQNKEAAVPEVVIPHFTDWQYKGFGGEIPESAEKVLNLILAQEKMDEKVSREEDLSVPEGFIFEIGNCFIPENDSYICVGTGINPDQAMNSVADYCEKALENYQKQMNLEKLDVTQEENYWVLVNPEYLNRERPYIAVRIYKAN